MCFGQVQLGQQQLPRFDWLNAKAYNQAGRGENSSIYQSGNFRFVLAEGLWERRELLATETEFDANSTELFPNPGRNFVTLSEPADSITLLVEDDLTPGLPGRTTNDVAPYLNRIRPTTPIKTDEVLNGALLRQRPSRGGNGNLDFPNNSIRYSFPDSIRSDKTFQFADYRLEFDYEGESSQNDQIPGGTYEFLVPVQFQQAPVLTLITNDVFRNVPFCDLEDNEIGRWSEDGIYEFDWRRFTTITWSDFLGERTNQDQSSGFGTNQTRLLVRYNDEESTENSFTYLPRGQAGTIINFGAQDVEDALEEEGADQANVTVPLVPIPGNPQLSSGSGVDTLVVAPFPVAGGVINTLGVNDNFINDGESITITPRSAMTPIEMIVTDFERDDIISLSGVDAVTGEVISFDLVRLADERVSRTFPPPGPTIQQVATVDLTTVINGAVLSELQVRFIDSDGGGIVAVTYIEDFSVGLLLPDGRQTSVDFGVNTFGRRTIPDDLGGLLNVSAVGDVIDCSLQLSRIRTSTNTAANIRGESRNTLDFRIRPIEAYEGWALQPSVIGFSFETGGLPANGGPFQDFDGDGALNLIEFAFSTDPSDATDRTLPGVEIDPETGQITLRVDKRPNVGGSITYFVESSKNLVDWVVVEEDDPIFEIVEASEAAIEVRSRISESPTECFLRVRIVQNF